MDKLLDILKSIKIVLPDGEMSIDQLLGWVNGYRACMEQMELITNMLKDQESVDIYSGEMNANNS